MWEIVEQFIDDNLSPSIVKRKLKKFLQININFQEYLYQIVGF